MPREMRQEEVAGHACRNLAWHARLMAGAAKVYPNWTVFRG